MSDERPTAVRYRVLAALCAAAAIAYIQRPLMGIAQTTVRVEYGMTAEQMGVLLSSWLWTYALFQIPAGRLADLWGARRTLALYCAVWSLATILVSVALSFRVLILLGLVFGAAQAGIFPCSAIIVRQWFPTEKRGLATGFVAAFQQVGAILATGLGGFWIAAYLGLWQPEWTARESVTISPAPQWLAALSESSGGLLRRVFHWTGMFVWFSVPGLLWAAWFRRWYRDVPSEHPAMNDAERALLPHDARPLPANDAAGEEVVGDEAVSAPPAGSEDPAATASPAAGTSPVPSAVADEDDVWSAMLTSPTMWLICAQQFFRAFSYIFYVTWFPTYLNLARKLTMEKSGVVTASMFAAALLGALCGGGISDWILARTGSRRLAKQGMAAVSLLGASAFLAAAYAVPSVELAVAVLFAGSLMAALAGPIGYSVTIDISGRQTATVFGAMNMSGNFGAALFPVAVPYILKTPDWVGIPGWDLVLIACAASYLAAATCWMLLDSSGTIFDRRRGKP